MNWRGCERKRSCPNSMCCPRIYRERLAKITKNYEWWTEPETSRIQSRLTTRQTAKFDNWRSESSVQSQETEASSSLFCSCVRDIALVGSASFRRRFSFSMNPGALTGLNKRGPHTGTLLRISHTNSYNKKLQYSLAPTWRILCPRLWQFTMKTCGFAPISLVMCVCPSVLQSLTTLEHTKILINIVKHNYFLLCTRLHVSTF